MKRVIISFLAVISICITTSQPVFAHVLKTDGTIGAILHIQPDDNPKSGTPTTYELAFKDTNYQFSIQNCNCTVTIRQNDKTLDTGPLIASSAHVSKNRYTFQNPGVYTLNVSGQPTQPNDFAPFSLTYTIRVEAGSGSKNLDSFPLTLAIGMALMIGLIMLAAYAMDLGEKEDNHKKE